jgi:hypothetical protein
MSGIISGFQKFFTKERIIIFVVLAVLLFFLMSYSGDKYSFSDNMDTGNNANVTMNNPLVPLNATKDKANKNEKNSDSSISSVVQPAALNGYSQQNIVQPSDLLPTDKNSQWSSLNPVNQGNPITPDLLQAGYHIGLDTIGQSLKNPNLQLRSDPYIPKSDVGPWNQSTYEPDLMRVPLEVGCGPQ